MAVNKNLSQPDQELNRWQRMLQGSFLWLFVLILTSGLTLIFSFNLVTAAPVNVAVGLPAAEDIFAPRSITYESQYLLQEAQQQVYDGVTEVYTRPENEDIGRRQLNRVRAVFSFIDVIRADALVSKETKLTYLDAIELLNLEEQVGLNVLDLTGEEYNFAKAEVTRIVGELMRDDIREEQIRDYQRIARRDVSLELTPTQENVVTALAPQFIVATVFPDMDTTAALRAEAVAGVEPIFVEISQDERIVRAGDIVTELDVEKLTQLGLLERTTDWRDVVAIFLGSFLFVVILTSYWQQFPVGVARDENGRYLTALTILILFFAILAKLTLATPGLFPYLFPIASLGMLLTVLFDSRLAMVVIFLMALLFGYNAPNSLELTIYAAAGGILAVLNLKDAQRINAFFRAGLVAAVGYAAVIVIFQYTRESTELLPALQLLSIGFINGIASAGLTLILFFILGSVMGLTTTLQLQELARFDHPLLQELLREAPGTYHHSIMVANLAEQAAENIKANSTLIRVGAFYHDIGKMNRPPFFTENQEGNSPHDNLDPLTSARIILNHVTDGLELAKKYRLPDRIRDFIAQHHGKRIVKGFYYKALDQAAEGEAVNIEEFRYPGPRPRSREVAIVMLADAVESTSRALQPNSEREIEKLVNTLIDEDVTEGQLNESGLTMGDISKIRASFIKTIKGRFHVRVKYPGNDEMMAGNETGLNSPEQQRNEAVIADAGLTTAGDGAAGPAENENGALEEMNDPAEVEELN
jgi:putative nucleotidyltransferase with HDIG domain